MLTSAGAKVQGINMMKEEFLDSYNGYHLGLPMDPMEPPSLSLPLGDDHSDNDAICKPPQPGRGCRREEFVALGLEKTLNNFFHFNFLNYYVSMPMEKKGQCVHLSAISQVGRTCRAPGLVTRGQKECQGPVWSPGGQSPYEYIKEYCNPPPPQLSC